MHKVLHNMPERKNFLLFAIALGIAGIIVGGITIWNMASDLLKP